MTFYCASCNHWMTLSDAFCDQPPPPELLTYPNNTFVNWIQTDHHLKVLNVTALVHSDLLEKVIFPVSQRVIKGDVGILLLRCYLVLDIFVCGDGDCYSAVDGRKPRKNEHWGTVQRLLAKEATPKTGPGVTEKKSSLFPWEGDSEVTTTPFVSTVCVQNIQPTKALICHADTNVDCVMSSCTYMCDVFR